MNGQRFLKDIEDIDCQRYLQYLEIQVDRDIFKIQRYKWIEIFKRYRLLEIFTSFQRYRWKDVEIKKDIKIQTLQLESQIFQTQVQQTLVLVKTRVKKCRPELNTYNRITITQIPDLIFQDYPKPKILLNLVVYFFVIQADKILLLLVILQNYTYMVIKKKL